MAVYLGDSMRHILIIIGFAIGLTNCSDDGMNDRLQIQTSTQLENNKSAPAEPLSVAEIRNLSNSELNEYFAENGYPHLSNEEIDQITDSDLDRIGVSRESFELFNQQAPQSLALTGKFKINLDTVRPENRESDALAEKIDEENESTGPADTDDDDTTDDDSGDDDTADPDPRRVANVLDKAPASCLVRHPATDHLRGGSPASYNHLSGIQTTFTDLGLTRPGLRLVAHITGGWWLNDDDDDEMHTKAPHFEMSNPSSSDVDISGDTLSVGINNLASNGELQKHNFIVENGSPTEAIPGATRSELWRGMCVNGETLIFRGERAGKFVNDDRIGTRRWVPTLTVPIEWKLTGKYSGPTWRTDLDCEGKIKEIVDFKLVAPVLIQKKLASLDGLITTLKITKSVAIGVLPVAGAIADIFNGDTAMGTAGLAADILTLGVASKVTAVGKLAKYTGVTARVVAKGRKTQAAIASVIAAGVSANRGKLLGTFFTAQGIRTFEVLEQAKNDGKYGSAAGKSVLILLETGFLVRELKVAVVPSVEWIHKSIVARQAKEYCHIVGNWLGNPKKVTGNKRDRNSSILKKLYSRSGRITENTPGSFSFQRAVGDEDGAGAILEAKATGLGGGGEGTIDLSLTGRGQDGVLSTAEIPVVPNEITSAGGRVCRVANQTGNLKKDHWTQIDGGGAQGHVDEIEEAWLTNYPGTNLPPNPGARAIRDLRPDGQENGLSDIVDIDPTALAAVRSWRDQVLNQARTSTGENLVAESVYVARGFKCKGCNIHADGAQTYLHATTTLRGDGTVIVPENCDLKSALNGQSVFGRPLEDISERFHYPTSIGETALFTGHGRKNAIQGAIVTPHASPINVAEDRITLFLNIVPAN
jgi:hypothetical protein